MCIYCSSLGISLINIPYKHEAFQGYGGTGEKRHYFRGKKTNFEKDNIGKHGTQENKISILGDRGTSHFISKEQVPQRRASNMHAGFAQSKI